MTDSEARYADVPRIRRLLAESKFDAIIVAWPENVNYLSGFYHPDMRLTWERLHIVVWPSGGEPTFVVPRVRADNWNGTPTPSWAPEETRPFIDDIRGYEGERLEMVRVVTDVLRERGILSGLVGVEFRSLPIKVSAELSRLLPGIKYDDAWPLLNEMRQVKTESEVEIITWANQLTARTIEEVLAGARHGETEIAVASRLTEKLQSQGAQELSHTIFGGGSRGGQWHPWPSSQKLEDGMLVRVDWGIREDGYSSDIARTAVIGTASNAQRAMFARLSEVHDIVVNATRPGVTAYELVDLARRHYERLRMEFRWSIVGHGIGLVLHEEPQLTIDYDEPLVEGMTLEIELGWVDPKQGYHIEDLVYIGHDATVNLTRPDGPRDLIQTAG